MIRFYSALLQKLLINGGWKICQILKRVLHPTIKNNIQSSSSMRNMVDGDTFCELATTIIIFIKIVQSSFKTSSFKPQAFSMLIL